METPTEAFEHVEDVLGFAADCAAAGQRCALAVVTGVEAGGVRDPGALMAVSETGEAAGYLSGGCIDADVAGHAGRAIETGAPARLRYGTGSPFMDIELPCGGAIDVLVLPQIDPAVAAAGREALAGRRAVELVVSEDGAALRGEGAAGEAFRYRPKPRLRLAGRGADLLALSRIAAACGFETVVQSPDAVCADAAARHGAKRIDALTTPLNLPEPDDDAWTAFLLLFHDAHWETALLAQALSGPAFYVGAVGSQRAQARRRASLAEAGVAERLIEGVRGPVGLVPRMRDASMLAVSALAEVVESYHADAPA